MCLKTKEMIVDFRRQEHSHGETFIYGQEVDIAPKNVFHRWHRASTMGCTPEWGRVELSRLSLNLAIYLFIYFVCYLTSLYLWMDLAIWQLCMPDLWSKGCEFQSRQERRENFLLQSQLCVLTLIRCPFHPRVIATARKRPRSFCQKCKWQATPIMHTSLTQRSRSGLIMLLSTHSVRTYQETSLHATR